MPKKSRKVKKIVVASRAEAEATMQEQGLELSPIFVYGTLRVGEYNYGRFMGSVIAVKDQVVKGYTLAVLARHQHYPYSIPDEGGEIVGDLLWITEPDYREIEYMELSAGYVVEIVKTVDGVTAIMFLANKGRLEEITEHGSKIGRSWLEYVAARREAERLQELEHVRKHYPAGSRVELTERRPGKGVVEGLNDQDELVVRLSIPAEDVRGLLYSEAELKKNDEEEAETEAAIKEVVDAEA